MRAELKEELRDFASVIAYKNGAKEYYDYGALIHISAPNPFGGTWSKWIDHSCHSRAWSADKIRRRRRYWVLNSTPDGPVWVEAINR